MPLYYDIKKECGKIDSLVKPDIDLSAFAPYKIHCDQCCGLCCVALYFSKSDGFPENKTAGTACTNLLGDYKCKVHAHLKARGLRGCMAYDCFGAGQKITQQLRGCPDWSSLSPKKSEGIFRAYYTVMQLHQTLWYLTQAATLQAADPVRVQIQALLQEGEMFAGQPLAALGNFDVDPFRSKANRLLKQTCSLAAALSAPHRAGQTKNYMGMDMGRKNLAGRDFSMSCLIAANLQQANVFGANFLGADLRDANIKNTDLRQSLFLTQIQINSAKGDRCTLLPPYLDRPASWAE